MRSLNKLSASEVKHARKGKLCDGGGLWLYKQDDGSGKWVLRVTVHGRRREMGLGSIQSVTLKQAREEAAKWRALAARGVDPVKERQRLAREAERNLHLLRDVAADAFESRKAELRGDGTAGRWFSPLEIHVLPKLGGVPVSQLDQVDIRDTLAPIWHEKASTATKAINRLGIVLKHAAALGLNVDLQATTKARALLGAQRHKVTSIPAMPWQEVPDFYACLGDGITELALRLLIVTAARSTPVRLAALDDFDLEARVWTIPAQHMKGREGKTDAFRVPLSAEAVRVAKLATPFARGGLLFPGRRGPMSDMTMSKFMRDRDLEFRPHGFRSSFRTWAEDSRAAPYEVCETALGHTVGNRVERSYQRSDLLEQRRALMERWATHVTGGAGQVVRMVTG